MPPRRSPRRQETKKSETGEDSISSTVELKLRRLSDTTRLALRWAEHAQEAMDDRRENTRYKAISKEASSRWRRTAAQIDCSQCTCSCSYIDAVVVVPWVSEKAFLDRRRCRVASTG